MSKPITFHLHDVTDDVDLPRTYDGYWDARTEMIALMRECQHSHHFEVRPDCMKGEART